MFSREYKPEKLKLMKEDYVDNSPYPHVVIDDFLNPEILKSASKAIHKGIDTLAWQKGDHPGQRYKKWIEKHKAMPEPARRVSQWLGGSDFLHFISEISGIPNLISDNFNLGGGIHCSSTGGRLGTHYDFNWNEELGLIRRINVLLFMNYDWEEKWKGNFQMWKTDRSEVAKEIEPIANRLVMFNTTLNSWHGFTEKIECPADRYRLSFAKYYYQYPEKHEDPNYKGGRLLKKNSIIDQSIFPDDLRSHNIKH